MLTTRQKIQLIFISITAFTGIKFYIYTNSLASGDFSMVKPGAVEGFLPISALMALKRFLFTGQYDAIHPAGLTIFIAALLLSIIINKSFCSHICPVGTVSELISSIGKNFKIHKYLYYLLVSIKYLLLAFFANIVLLKLNVKMIENFLNTPYNKIADAKMMHFFLNPSLTTIYVMATLLVLTLLFNNFWCRFLCPYGALLGITATISPFKIVRNKEACIKCQKCTSVCPMSIEVHKKNKIISPDCMGCFECIENRSNDKCLKINYSPLKPKQMSAIIFVMFFLIIAIAILTGNWLSSVSNLEYSEILKYIDRLSH